MRPGTLAMTLPRFYQEHLPVTGCFCLNDDELRHARSVMRLSVGDEVSAFDGRGGEAKCAITHVSHRRMELQVLARSDSDRELAVAVHFLVALPKGDRQKSLVDFLVQLGVHSLRPLITRRGVAQPVDSAFPGCDGLLSSRASNVVEIV